nr:N-acetylmuramoyl-L-alanine amidase [Bacillus sp. V3B]
MFVDYGVSAHYMVGRKGETYDLVPENRVAYHAGKGVLPNFPQYKDQLNHYSIGIELRAIGTNDEMRSMISDSVYRSISPDHLGYTDAQ